MATEEQRISRLEERVRSLEHGVYRAGLIATVAALVLGFIVPFLSATEDAYEDLDDDEYDSIAILAAVFDIGDAGDGPFERQALTVAVLVGLLALVAVLALLVTAGTWSQDLRERLGRASNFLCGFLLLGCVGGWLLVLVLNGHFDGQVSAFSPALLCLTVGAVGGLLLHQYDAET
jgi:hypothetical protein